MSLKRRELVHHAAGQPDAAAIRLLEPGFAPAFVKQQLTTEAKMATMVFPDDGLIAQKQRAWTLEWQEIMST